MSKNFTHKEAAEILQAWYNDRKAELAKSLKELRDRELKKVSLSKALIPPHKHTTSSSVSGANDDIPPGKINPVGTNDVLKGKPMEDSHIAGRPEETSGERSPADVLDDAMKKEELCKKCGKVHMLDKCSMTKAMYRDEKGNEVDTGKVDGAVLPSDKKSKKIESSGSGELEKQDPNPNKKIMHIHALADASKQAGTRPVPKLPKLPNPAQHAARQATFNEFTPKGHFDKTELLAKPPVSEAQRAAMGAAASGNSTLGIPKSVGKEFIDADKGGKLPVKKNDVPMAKPPSGVNMATHVPTSKSPGIVKKSEPLNKAGLFSAHETGLEPTAISPTKVLSTIPSLKAKTGVAKPAAPVGPIPTPAGIKTPPVLTSIPKLKPGVPKTAQGFDDKTLIGNSNPTVSAEVPNNSPTVTSPTAKLPKTNVTSTGGTKTEVPLG